MRSLLSFAILFALSLLARVGSTQPSDDEAHRAAYREGYAAIQAKKWDQAYAIFQRLWRDTPTYDVALHLGHAEFNLGKNRDAAEHLAFGIAHLPPGEGKELVDSSRRALDRVKQEIGTLTIIVDRTGAAVRIDGKPQGTTPVDSEIFVDPGDHVIDATLAGYQTATQNFQTARGDQQTIVLKLDVLPVTSAAAATDTPPPPPPQASYQGGGPSARTIALIVGAGVTVAAGVTSLVFVLKSNSASKRADDARAEANRYGPNACAEPSTAPPSVCTSLKNAEDDRVAANKGANISLVVTGVAFVATATMFIAWPRKKTGDSASVTLTPSIGRDSGALLINGSF
jgi:hypothetical protein